VHQEGIAPSIPDSPPHYLLLRLRSAQTCSDHSSDICDRFCGLCRIRRYQFQYRTASATRGVSLKKVSHLPEVSSRYPAALPLTWTTRRERPLTTSLMSATDYLSFGESSDITFKTAPRQRSAAYAERIWRCCAAPTYQLGNRLTYAAQTCSNYLRNVCDRFFELWRIQRYHFQDCAASAKCGVCGEEVLRLRCPRLCRATT
jgi:hypothetical protein